MKKDSIKEKRETIIEYIKKNPKTTYKDIRINIKLHPERYFNGLKEAFKLAGVKSPRTFDVKTKEQRQKIIIDYIRKNPTVGGHTIAKETKINPSNVFKNIEEAYSLAKINYPRKVNTSLKKRSRKDREKQIIGLIKKNPLITVSEIISQTKISLYKTFPDIQRIYKKAGVKRISGPMKRTTKKQQDIIKYIKKNPLATQREINKFCKTHVQKTFQRGIFEAYEKAGIKFPFERLKLYGIGIKEIRERAKSFEEKIAIKLLGYGKVNRLVKTKRGFVDIILERKNKKSVIEVKDYQKKDISISQINQVNKYLEDCNCNLGFLICRKKPKRDKFLIGKNRIFVVECKELDKISKLIDGSVL